MSTYHPTPEQIERDADTLTTTLGHALRRLDELGAHRKPDEETFIGHCYQTIGEPRRAAT